MSDPQLHREENSFPLSFNDAMHEDLRRKEIQQPQNSSLLMSERQPTYIGTTVNARASLEEVSHLPSLEQQPRRTVTFDDDQSAFVSIANRAMRTSNIGSRLSGRNSVPNEQQQKESLPTVTGATTEDFSDMLVDDEYIPGGFIALDQELEEELLNDFDDDFDDAVMRRSRYISSLRSSEPVTAVTRSPIELWQRARILIAIHLYKIQTRMAEEPRNTLRASITIDPSMRKITDESKPLISTNELDHLEKLIEHKSTRDDRKINFGLSIVKQLSLGSPEEQYQCVDFYDVGLGYIIISNVVSTKEVEINTPATPNKEGTPSLNKSANQKDKPYGSISTRRIDPALSHDGGKLLVYPIERTVSNEIRSVEFDCPLQFNFMICVPVFRLILGLVNINSHKSSMILIGDASRKGMFLSKQDLSGHAHSVLYVHEASFLFIGCTDRVLQYNTQPLQFTSQPVFISELAHLPLESRETVIHMCQIRTHRSIGLLSNRYFLLWQYAPEEQLLLKFCNPARYGFMRCHYDAQFDYLIFAFADGSMLLYQFDQMKRLRRYHCHWKAITELKTNRSLLLSSSLDHRINVWNLEILQHLYQYDASVEIFQLDIVHEDLFYYRTLREIVLFKLNLYTLLFSVLKTRVRALKLFVDTQRIARIAAVLENDSCVLISPVSGCCLTYVPNVAKKPIKQVLHDITRSTLYCLHSDGEIVLYHTQHDPCVAEYRIRAKSEQHAITCMTLLNPTRTHLFTLGAVEVSTEKALAKPMIFFGHASGYISLFQGDALLMDPLLAHKTSLVCLETSQASMEMSNRAFTNSEVLLSCGTDRTIHVWDLTLNKLEESIQLIHIVAVEQEKNISLESIRFLAMIDNFLVANYSDQTFLHIWQLLNISIQTNDRDRWGIVEHPTKGSPHHGQIQAICATSTLKLFASSDTEGCIKIWDNTNSLLRELHLDRTFAAIEFLSQTGELAVAYQDNLHLILPQNYLINYKKLKTKQPITMNSIAEDSRLEVARPLPIPYQSLPVFDYKFKSHHRKRRLQRFERQLAGRFVVVDSDSSHSDQENNTADIPDRASIVSDDSNWAGLAEDVKDILRLKKYESLHETNK